MGIGYISLVAVSGVPRFFVDLGMAGSAYPIRVGPSVFKLVVPIDYPTPRNPGEIAVFHHFPIIPIL